MSRWTKRWQRWIARRIPPAPALVLTQRRLFIFPTRTGFFFLVCLLIMLLAAINYQNNMSYALTFLLANLFVIAILHTYANLSGLALRGVRSPPVFAYQQAEFVVALEAKKGRTHQAVLVQWPEVSQALVEECADSPVQVHLTHPVNNRGRYRPPRLKVSSVYPLGLLRCWSWIDLDFETTVYPQPVSLPRQQVNDSEGVDGDSREQLGAEDFYGLRPYREGDAIKHIHWSSLAKAGVLQSRSYSQQEASSDWLDWHDYPGYGTEARLSALCAQVLDCELQGANYGLRLQQQALAPASGPAQRDAALGMLALYGHHT